MAFRDAPIRRKLMTMILGTSGVVLLLTCAAFLGYEFFTFRQTAMEQLATRAEIIATNSTAAVAFEDANSAADVLAALRADPHIVAACLYDKRGKIFSRYPATAPDDAFPPAPRAAELDGFRFTRNRLIGFTPVVQVKG